MDHLSTSADISGRIGALELGDTLESHGDGALEAAGADLSPQPITNSLSCIRTFRCIGDGALESAAGAIMGGGPMQPTNPFAHCPATIHGVIGSPCAGDGELETAAMGLNPTQPVTNPVRFCMRTYYCVTDGALELAAGASMNPPITSPMNIACAHTRVSDADLEAASMAPQVTQNIVCLPRFIDDGALEAVGPGTGPRPTSHAFGCSIVPGIAEISDGELEAAGSRLTHMPTTPPDCTISPRHSCAGDAALEAAGANTGFGDVPMQTTPPYCVVGPGRGVDDAALEAAAGASMNPPITSPLNIACAHTRVGDADLEAAMSMAPQVTQNIVCLPRFIEDGALEAVGPATGPKPTSRAMGCPFIDEISDAALEAAGSRLTYMPTSPPDCTISPRHSCASDAALEAAGVPWALGGPQTNLAFGTMCCPRFSDAALEAAGPATGPRPTCPMMGCPFIEMPGISDRALESAGANPSMGPSINMCGPLPNTALCGH